MKNFKFIKVLIITLVLIGTIFMGVVNAQEAIPSTDDYEPSGEISEKTTNLAGKIAGVLQTVGIVLAVISMGILGIKYIIGSVEEKAQYKKSMILYLAGAIFLVLTGTILKLVSELTNDALK